MRSFQASKRNFSKNALLLLPAALEVLIYDVTFLHQYGSTIISFRVRTEYAASKTKKKVYLYEGVFQKERVFHRDRS